MTKYSILLALGATCLLSRSASAQRTEPPAKPEGQIRIERHIQSSDGEDHHITIVGDSVILLVHPEADTDHSDGDDASIDEEIDTDVDAEIDTEVDDDAAIDTHIDMDALHDAVNERIRSINAQAINGRHDSIRALVRERLRSAEKLRERSQQRNALTARLASTKEIDAQVKKLMRDLNGKMRELQRIRVTVDRDTVGLAMELTSARNALEAAREALETNRTALEAARHTIDRDDNIMEATRKAMERNRSIVERNRQVIDAQRQVMNHNRQVIDAQRNVMNYAHTPPATAYWPFGGSDSTTLAAINSYGSAVAQWGPSSEYTSNGYFGIGRDNDSAYRQIWINQPYNRNAPSFRSFIDSTNGNHILLMPMDEFQPVEPIQPLEPLQPMNRAIAMDGNGKVIVLESDSIRVVDSRDAQTIIRIVRDTTVHGHTSRTIILTTPRNSGLDMQLCASASTVTTDMAAATATAALNIPSAPGYILGTNRPNPFSGTTTIPFTLPQPGHITLTVFDATGTVVRVLKDEMVAAGSHTVVFDGSTLPSGTYLYRLASGAFSETKTMTLEK